MKIKNIVLKEEHLTHSLKLGKGEPHLLDEGVEALELLEEDDLCRGERRDKRVAHTVEVKVLRELGLDAGSDASNKLL